jgi:hypothetical protein
MIAFLRRNLLVILFGLLIVGQAMTWYAVVDLKRSLPRDPPRCSPSDPCFVELNEYTLRQLRPH